MKKDMIKFDEQNKLKSFHYLNYRQNTWNHFHNKFHFIKNSD